MRRGTKAYFAASLTAQAAALLRYTLLARLLGPEELGLAATLILTSQFFETVSDTGANRFIVQDSRGDEKEMQGVVHLALAMRGVLIAVALALTSGLVAKIYQAPVIAPALIALGLAPLINGFMHLDVRRLQRSGDFRPEAYSTICGEITSAVVTGAAAWIVRDHTAVIYGLVARASIMVLLSHVLAKRLYNWAFGKADAVKFSRFAAPLFLNGLIFFFGSQGDRFIVGSAVGPTNLGLYAAILLLIYYPSSSVSRFLAGIHLPILASARDTTDRFVRQVDRLSARTYLIATAMLVGFTLVAPIVAPLLYGGRFAQALPLYAVLATLQGMRLLRTWPNVVALGVGDSVMVLTNNVTRLVALPFAFAAGYVWHSLYAIVVAFIVGEVLAQVVVLFQLGRRGLLPGAAERRRTPLFLAIAASAIACSVAVEARAWPWAAIAAGAGATLVLSVALTEREALGEAWAMIEKRLSRRKVRPPGADSAGGSAA